MGSEVGAGLAAIEPLRVDLIGLNRSTGPAEIRRDGIETIEAVGQPRPRAAPPRVTRG
ncbi:hypothetical protein [Micromonospora sp. NBC_00421]|uniref:hypothetical protein n=1 Tax=Micromonospora sp. NBC_00421 TaxID=2975976 RepID=UPI002E1D26BE